VNFVDDVYLVASRTGREQNLFFYLTDIVHAGIGSAVNFQHIHAGPPDYFLTLAANTARIGSGSFFAAQCPGQNTGRACFAAAAGPGEKICMGNVSLLKGIFECSGYKFLACQFIKCLGSPPGSGHFIGHFLSIAFLRIKKKAAGMPG
jgi:hypothetical protein